MNQNAKSPKNLKRSSASPIVCRCNNVTLATLEEAIRQGADTMNKIFDITTAGVGPCGGSCRRKIVPLLEKFLEHKKLTGEFPEATPILKQPTAKK